MSKPRTELELLHVLRDAMKSGNNLEGMCHAVSDLETVESITRDEEAILMSYLKAKAPQRVKNEAKDLAERCAANGATDDPINIFWYDVNDILSRVRWLTRRINREKYSKQ